MSSSSKSHPTERRALSAPVHASKTGEEAQGPIKSRDFFTDVEGTKSRRPPEQLYGEPVEHRLQERLSDPHWQIKTAARIDKRKEERSVAEEEGHTQPGDSINPVVPLAGMPPPPPASLGSATMMSNHYKAHSPAQKVALNFNPANNTMYICGRPTQLLMLSHEMAPELERDEYVPWVFRPLVAHCIEGYSADSRDAPGGPRHFCVIRWFQVNVIKGKEAYSTKAYFLWGCMLGESLSPPVT